MRRSSLGLQVGLWFVFLSLVHPVFGQTSENSVGAVTAALRAGEFARALQLLQPALQQAPRNPQLWTLQGLAYSGERRKKDALESFRGALKIAPDYLPALEGAAQIEYEAGSFEAVPLLERVLRLRPDDRTSHAMLAVLAYKKGDCPTAVRNFEQSETLASSQPAAWEEFGLCLVKVGKLDRAAAVFQTAVERNASDSRARYELAAVQLMAENPNGAIATMKPLLDGDSADANVLSLASSAYETIGNTPEAVRMLRLAIVTNPRNTDLYIDFANLSMDHQSFQVGVDVINSGLKVQPGAAPLYVARGILYVQMARYDEAESDFEKANSLDPKAAIGSVAQGLEAVQNNDPDRALAKVRARLAKKPDDAYLLYLQADILTEKGVEPGTPDFAAAVRSAKKAVGLQPSLSSARDVLAKLYLQAGENQPAIEECRKALRSDAKDQAALYHLIQALRRTGNTEELPELVKRLADLRAESTKKEREHNRYKLVEATAPPDAPSLQ